MDSRITAIRQRSGQLRENRSGGGQIADVGEPLCQPAGVPAATCTTMTPGQGPSPVGFPGGPGRTTNPVTFDSLIGGLDERVFGRLPDETWIYPGHGNDTTLGAERLHLEEWRERGW